MYVNKEISWRSSFTKSEARFFTCAVESSNWVRYIAKTFSSFTFSCSELESVSYSFREIRPLGPSTETNPKYGFTVSLAPKGKGKGRFLELFQHWGHLAYCILAPNKFPPEAPRIIQMRETSTSEGGNYYQILLANSNLRKSARIFYMPQRWDVGQILLLPLRRKAYWGFSGHLKNPIRPGLNPRSRVPVTSILSILLYW